jgi:hypothetical protein
MNPSSPSNFNYKNTEVKTMTGGSKVVRHVSIKNGKGYKTVIKYHKGKKTGTVKKNIHKAHIRLIQRGKFIPGLFLDCDIKEKNRTQKNKRRKTR